MTTTQGLVAYSSLLLVTVFLREGAADRLAPPTLGEGIDSYSKFAQSDCGGKDVAPQPSCGGNRNLSVAALETCCDSTRGCGGFNTHGVIKDATCAAHVHPQPTTDLYLKSNQPSAPAPAMPWPFPNDAQMSTGATTVQLSPDFAISAPARS